MVDSAIAVIGVSDGADRRQSAGGRERVGVANREILTAGVGVLDQPAT